MTFREFLAAVAEESKNTYRPDCVNSSIYRLQVDDKLALEIINDLDRIDCLRGVVAGLRSGYGLYRQSMTHGARLAFPAQELVLVEREGRKNRRLRERWEECGGRIVGRRRIALKSDPIWTELSFFGFPFPPFDVSCGYSVNDVEWDTAARLGIVDASHFEPPEIEMPPDPEFSFTDEVYMRAVCQRIIDVIK